MATLTVTAVGGDRIVYKEFRFEDMATIRSGIGDQAGAGNTDQTTLSAAGTGGNFRILVRTIFAFDTSPLTSNVTITSATLYLYGTGKDNGLGNDTLHIVASTPADYSAPTAADYAQTGSTTFGNVTYANYSTTGYNAIPLNASGLANISKTSISKFATRGGWELNNSFTGTFVPNASTSFFHSSMNELGFTKDPMLIIEYYINLTNPGNVYADDVSYATAPSADGIITVELSKDAGVTYQSTLSKTFGSTETLETYGTSSTELWGTTWLGNDLTDTSFRLRVAIGSAGSYKQVYKTFGFSPGSTTQITGIEIAIRAKWTGGTTSINIIKVKIYYGSSILPVGVGSQAFATNGRKNGEGAGVGTGVLVFHDGIAWRSCDTGSTVSA